MHTVEFDLFSASLRFCGAVCKLLVMFPQIKQPLAKGPSRISSQQDIRKKRPAGKYPDEDDGDEAISIIRKMFGYVILALIFALLTVYCIFQLRVVLPM